METLTLKVPYNSHTFSIQGSEKDGSIMNEIRVTNGYYEPFLMTFFSRVVSPDAICLDIGANIGTISLCLSNLAYDGMVYAFEASKNNYIYLLKNIGKNDINNIEPLHLGIYDKKCSMDIQYIEEFAGGAFMNTTGATDVRSIMETIHCVSLDEWIEEKGLTRLDIMKLDIEGAEVKAIEGAMKTIQRFKPDFVVEYNEVTLERFFGEHPEAFYQKLCSIYPKVSLISRENGDLIELSSFADLHAIAQTHGGVDNLYCTFK